MIALPRYSSLSRARSRRTVTTVPDGGLQHYSTAILPERAGILPWRKLAAPASDTAATKPATPTSR